MEFIAFCSFRVKSNKNFFNNLLKNDIPAPAWTQRWLRVRVDGVVVGFVRMVFICLFSVFQMHKPNEPKRRNGKKVRAEQRNCFTLNNNNNNKNRLREEKKNLLKIYWLPFCCHQIDFNSSSSFLLVLPLFLFAWLFHFYRRRLLIFGETVK